jgi:hypothetical protein
MRRAFAIAVFVMSLPPGGTAHAETPIPTRFGIWKNACFSGMQSGEKPSCMLGAAIGDVGSPHGESAAIFSMSSGDGEFIDVLTTGRNEQTCQIVSIKEQVYRGYNPLNTDPTDEAIDGIARKLLVVMKSHARLFGVCTAMSKPVGPYPTSILDETEPDFRRAVYDFERNVRGIGKVRQDRLRQRKP